MVLSTAMVLISCTHKSPVIIPDVSFKNDIVPVFQASCALNGSCHLGANNTNLQVNLDSGAAYNTIIAKQLINTSNPTASLLYVELSNGIMPKAPYRALSSIQVSLILDWIKQGGLNN